MKLFKCPKCGNHSRKTHLTMPWRMLVELNPDQTWSVRAVCPDPLPYHMNTEKLDMPSTVCSECESPLELVEVAYCPHKTGADCWDYMRSGTRRNCRLCGEAQEAKTVIFE